MTKEQYNLQSSPAEIENEFIHNNTLDDGLNLVSDFMRVVCLQYIRGDNNSIDNRLYVLYFLVSALREEGSLKYHLEATVPHLFTEQNSPEIFRALLGGTI